MIVSSELQKMIEEAFPGATVEVADLTGTSDHYRVEVRSSIFHEKSLIEQHRLVKDAVQSAYDDGRLHALTIKTIAE